MFLTRLCVKPYKLNDGSGQTYQLNKGEGVNIPVVGIHRDPDYYPDPDRFDPERFSVSRKHSIKPFTYLPFGSGPRNCIGIDLSIYLAILLYFFFRPIF